MKMTLRWYGPGYDSVSLKQIRQIPGVSGVITTLYGTSPGEAWELEDIRGLKQTVEDAGLVIEGIESVNVSDAIKTAGPDRDAHIENYIKTLDRLGSLGIRVICYNFMPVFDWTRSELARVRPDGSTVLAYNQDVIDKLDPDHMKESIDSMSNGFVMPGWEPDRLESLKELFALYQDMDEDTLFGNLVYFLEAIGPVCEKHDIRMAIHPDDPAWPIFGLPRIVTGLESYKRLLKAVDKPYNSITLCTGSLGTNPKNDIPEIIRYAKDRIAFAHVRNLKYNSPRDFEEAAHLSSDGSMDLYEIMKALWDVKFDGPIRPDHGRMIWGEEAMPGYGLYDRALGSQYLLGLYEAIVKDHKREG